MLQLIPTVQRSEAGQTRGYATPPSSSLHERMAFQLLFTAVENGDAKAFEELFNRPALDVAGTRMCFWEYLYHLKDSWDADQCCHGNQLTKEMALDLALQKFLPFGIDVARDVSVGEGLQPVLLRIYDRFPDIDTVDPIVLENSIIAAIKGFIRLTYRRACHEVVRRETKLKKRYAWSVTDSRQVRVYVAREIPGRRIGKFLNNRYQQSYPTGDLATWAQKEVDAQFGDRNIRSAEILDSYVDPDATSFEASLFDIDDLIEDVCDEKIDSIGDLRPSVAWIGPKLLRELITDILTSIASGNYMAKEIAERYGISESSLSRFAGLRGPVDDGDSLPDLWKNVLTLLAGDARFAREYGSLLGKLTSRQEFHPISQFGPSDLDFIKSIILAFQKNRDPRLAIRDVLISRVTSPYPPIAAFNEINAAMHVWADDHKADEEIRRDWMEMKTDSPWSASLCLKNDAGYSIVKPFDPNGKCIFARIDAGQYSLFLDTGVLLWSGNVTVDKRLSNRPSQKVPLRLAASDESEGVRTVDIESIRAVLRIDGDTLTIARKES